MKRFVVGLLAMGACWAATGNLASAQTPGRPNNPLAGPAVPSMVNMSRPGNAAVNYYGIVQPQTNTSKQLNSLQNQITQQQLMPQLGAAAAEDDGLMGSYAITGHTSQFFNYSHYYGQGGFSRPTQPPQGVTKK